MNIANQGFPATRADINNALQALASNNSGTSAPSTMFANQWWYDTTNNKLYIRNEANNAWIQVAVLDQTNNEWQVITGVIQAKDGDGLVFKTDDGTTRIAIADSDGDVAFDTDTLYVDATNDRIGVNNDAPATAIHVNTTTAGAITSGAARTGSVLRLEHTAAWENGYTGGDFLGGIEFETGDTSGGVGVRAAIRGTVDSYFNTNSLAFYTCDQGDATLDERMRIDHKGRVTKPTQPAFLAQPSSQQDNIAADGNNVTVALGTERFDVGSNFSSNVFTAPVTGKYLLCANLYLVNIDSAINYMQLTLNTSNRLYYFAFDTGSTDADPNRMTFQVNVLADMDASDQSWLGILQSGGTAQTDIAVESYFSGALIC